MREVRVFDGDFPSYEQILAGDPTAVFPKEIWLQQVQPGEFAVRYKDFKDPAERDCFLKLASEYQRKVREALSEMLPGRFSGKRLR